jgi:hypothetical protein
VKRQIQKYKYMLDVAQYQREINALSENIAFDMPNEEIERKLDVLYCERKPIYEESLRLKNITRKNNDFKKYITSMQIVVQASNGEEIPVNEHTIKYFRDNVEYLTAKRKLIAAQLADVDKKINSLKQQQKKENTMFDVQTTIQSFDADISKMRVDARISQSVIKQLEKERKILEDKITQCIKQNSPIITELHTSILGYAKELNVDEQYVRPNTDYIFTNDLKSLSGAIFHKIVFAFKLSYVKLIFKHTEVRLPIVLDSPSGREVDEINISDMIKILARDFTEHQIIIASIHLYNDFSNVNTIEIKDRLLSFGKIA